MDDLISRQDAIDVLEERLRANGYSNVALVSELNRSIGYLMRLPSAQPKLAEKVEDILTYLDTELHPIVSPEHWNIYSELYDMVSTLPTIQTERKKGKWIKRGVSLYRCSECGRFSPSQENYCPRCGSYNGEEKDNVEIH